ncbi:MAG TPA: hypothetical protein VJI46_06290 [Candidatus Nanoarchaeia archaeon]|nr:hypothetical protein [Candidatus Nanoarchaeia archaeon]
MWDIGRADINFVLLLIVLLMVVPAFFFDETIGNLITGRAVEGDLTIQVQEFASFFPLTAYSQASRVCLSIGPDSFEVLNEAGIFSTGKISACEPSHDFILVFESADEFTALANEPTCANFFSQKGYSYAPSRYWDGDYTCSSDFKQSYCSGVDFCSIEAEVPSSLFSCCTQAGEVFVEEGQETGMTGSEQEENGAEEQSGEEPVFIKRPSSSGDIVGKASAPTNSSSAVTYIIYVVVGVFLAVGVIGTIHSRKKKRLERNRAVIKISMWARKSSDLGFTQDQIATVLRRRNIPEGVVNDAFSLAFGKR